MEVEFGFSSVHFVERDDGPESANASLCRSLRSSLSCTTKLIIGRVSLFEREFRSVKNSCVVEGSMVRIMPLSPFMLSVAYQPVGISNSDIPYLGFVYFPLRSCLKSGVPEPLLAVLLELLPTFGLAKEFLEKDSSSWLLVEIISG